MIDEIASREDMMDEHHPYDRLDAFTPIEIKKAHAILSPIPNEMGETIKRLLGKHGARVVQEGELYEMPDPDSKESVLVRNYKIVFPEKSRKEVGMFSHLDIQAYTIVFPDGFILRVREKGGKCIIYLQKDQL